MESSCVLELRRKRYSDVNVKVHCPVALLQREHLLRSSWGSAWCHIIRLMS